LRKLIDAERTITYARIGTERYFGTSPTFNDEVNSKLSHINAYLKEACNVLEYIEGDMQNWGHFCIKHSEGGLQAMHNYRNYSI
jgi:hypothetical protein